MRARRSSLPTAESTRAKPNYCGQLPTAWIVRYRHLFLSRLVKQSDIERSHADGFSTTTRARPAQDPAADFLFRAGCVADYCSGLSGDAVHSGFFSVDQT